MAIKFQRRGGRKPPRDNEVLTIEDDGSFDLWRSVGWTTQPPAPVGRFGGQLEETERIRLQEEVAAAQAAGDLQQTPRPDSSIDSVELPGARARLGNNDRVSGPWAPLIDHLRSLLGELTRSPRAALGLEVKADGRGARLVHLGSEPLRLNLDGLTVRAVLWRENRKAGDWTAPAESRPSGRSAETSEDGWTFDLPFGHGFEVDGESEVVAYVTLGLYDDERQVPVSLESARRRER
jgi:hypothetical protein